MNDSKVGAGRGVMDEGRSTGSGSATLRDVARVAGVHVSTVSRVLNGQASAGRITPETEERIRVIADDLGYRRNTVARALRTGRTLSLGIIVPDIANLYQAGITRGAGDAASESGFSLLLSSTDDSIEGARSQVTAMLSAQAEGLLYGVARADDPVLQSVVDSGTPVVLFNRATSPPRLPSVLPDDRTGTQMAVEHLLALGHRHVGHVGGPGDISSSVNRLSAFEESLERAGLEPGPIETTDRHTEEEGLRVTRSLLAAHPQTTAIVAANDRLALGAIDAIRESGRRCPGDVSVVGFNDMPYADRFSPSLTTIRISQYELGHTATSLLLAIISREAQEVVTKLIRPELIVRESTGPLPTR